MRFFLTKVYQLIVWSNREWAGGLGFQQTVYHNFYISNLTN